ncbi:uncharacterized protein LOC108681479 [Hyalella azteca]|uniref:Uncharacterized protein LOC108681479 n=1 Tax=Hyalella azteca TaxID=294128 RepID=A0A8B7PIL9_HYAAZ|nr:uncharacterized protein LOC108681479 [Hyalella azteca]
MSPCKLLALIIFVSFSTPGLSLKCYLCSGYNAQQPEGTYNNPYCTDANFKKSKVETIKDVGNSCIKRVIYSNGMQFVERFQGSRSASRATKRSANEALNATEDRAFIVAREAQAHDETSMVMTIDDDINGVEKLAQDRPDKEERGAFAYDHKKFHRERRQLGYVDYYCSKNFCNAGSQQKFSASLILLTGLWTLIGTRG